MCLDKEGVEPANWLNAQGIAVAVVKYRTIDPKLERNATTIAPVFADPGRAVRVLRAHAQEWNIDPNRITLLGFSAGAIMAVRLTMDADDGDARAADPIDRLSSRPNAVALVYGSVVGKVKMPSSIPPFFIVHAVDDPKAPVATIDGLTKYLREAKASYEVHLFHRGDHGFGILPTAGTVRSWPTLFTAWLQDQGLRD